MPTLTNGGSRLYSLPYGRRKTQVTSESFRAVLLVAVQATRASEQSGAWSSGYAKPRGPQDDRGSYREGSRRSRTEEGSSSSGRSREARNSRKSIQNRPCGFRGGECVVAGTLARSSFLSSLRRGEVGLCSKLLANSNRRSGVRRTTSTVSSRCLGLWELWEHALLQRGHDGLTAAGTEVRPCPTAPFPRKQSRP